MPRQQNSVLHCDLWVGKYVRVPGCRANCGALGTITKVTRQHVKVKLDGSGKHCCIKNINLVPARVRWQNRALMAGRACMEDECKTPTDVWCWVDGLAKELVASQHYAQPHMFNFLHAALSHEVELLASLSDGSLPSDSSSDQSLIKNVPSDDHVIHHSFSD